jgi:ligand-binding SRPBCC domain-containing protein
MIYQLRRRQRLGGTLEEVFAFFKDPANLEAITPPWLGFRMKHTTDSVVTEGTEIEYRIRMHGIPMRWVSRITEFVENHSFADEMLAGPYRSWVHRHLFHEVAGGVEAEDIVDYQLPLGPLGRLAHAVWVRRQLATIFDYRETEMARRFPVIPQDTDTGGR